MQTLRAGTTVDRFVVEGLLGVGGMASVYAVRHRVLGSHHALKLLHVNDPSARERLRREGQTQASLRHPNVVAVSDIVEIGGALGLVMELVEGRTLRHLLQTTTLDAVQVDDLARGLLAGTLATHAHGVVHRDLKPTNILLAIEDGRLVPRIADFGLVKALGDALGATTRTGDSLGTPGYMSPEQLVDARRVDHRADVFALGAVLYELVTGVRAFGSDGAFPVMSRVREGRYKPVRELAPGTPDRICQAIEGALRTDMDQRTQSVLELACAWTGLSPDATRAALARGPAATWDPEVQRAVHRPVVSSEHAATAPPAAPAVAPTRPPAWRGPVLAGLVSFAVVLLAAWAWISARG